MKKKGSKLRNLVLAGTLALGLAGGLKGQYYTANPFLQPNDTTKLPVWDTLKNSSERNARLDDRLYNYDKTDTITASWSFVCTAFARQLCINFNGYGELGFDPAEGLESNGWHNIPMYTVTLMKPNTFHQINGVVIGDDATKFSDWRFIEPQNDSTYKSEQFIQAEVYKVVVNYTYVEENEIQGKFLSSVPMFEFIPDGNGEWKDSGWRNEDVKMIEKRDTVPPQNNISVSGDTLSWNVIDENFKSAEYSLDGGENWTSVSKSGTKKLNLENGDYDLKFNSEDYFRHSTTTDTNFEVNYVEPPVGFDQVERQEVISEVFPNPARDYINFSFKPGNDTELTIYTLDGSEVERIKTINGTISIDLRNYSTGIYLYRNVNKERTEIGEFIVK